MEMKMKMMSISMGCQQRTHGSFDPVSHPCSLGLRIQGPMKVTVLVSVLGMVMAMAMRMTHRWERDGGVETAGGSTSLA